jgi:hypothetical protein
MVLVPHHLASTVAAVLEGAAHAGAVVAYDASNFARCVGIGPNGIRQTPCGIGGSPKGCNKDINNLHGVHHVRIRISEMVMNRMSEIFVLGVKNKESR